MSGPCTPTTPDLAGDSPTDPWPTTSSTSATTWTSSVATSATGRSTLARPAREVPFTVVGREERYKSKAFIDAAVYRGGDLVSGWIYAGLATLGLSIGAISLVSAPVMAIWVAIGLVLGREQEEKARGDAAARGGSVEEGAVVGAEL